jgi:hypothetical protein
MQERLSLPQLLPKEVRGVAAVHVKTTVRQTTIVKVAAAAALQVIGEFSVSQTRFALSFPFDAITFYRDRVSTIVVDAVELHDCRVAPDST